MAKHRLPEEQRYRGLLKWVQYVVARFIIILIVHLPIRIAYRLGLCVGWIFWKLAKKRRLTVRKNLEVVNTWLSQQSAAFCEERAAIGMNCSLDEQVKEVFYRGGANLLSGFTFARMSALEAGQHLEVEGLEYLKAAISDGRGAILLLAHMGPWEALVQLPELAAMEGIHSPLGALYRPLNNRYLDDWYKGQRERAGTKLFSRRDGFHKPVDFLRKGGILGILADQKMRQGESAEFFGKVCKTNPLPGLFQRRSGVDLLGLSITTIDCCRWRLKFKPVDFSAVAADRTRSTEARVSNQCLEEMLATSPLDVFWFHKRF